MTHSTTKGPRVLLQLSRIKHKWSTINLPFILESNYYQHIDKQIAYDTEVLVILEILEIIPPEENFFLVLMTYKLLTEAEIEGGFLLVGDQCSLKKIKHNVKGT